MAAGGYEVSRPADAVGRRSVVIKADATISDQFVVPKVVSNIMIDLRFIELLPEESRPAAMKVVEWVASKNGDVHLSERSWYCYTVSHRENEGRPKYPIFYITPSAKVSLFPSRLYSRPNMSPNHYPPFDDIEIRRGLVQRIDRLTRERVPKSLDSVREFDLALLDEDDKFSEFCGIVSWIVEEIQKS